MTDSALGSLRVVPKRPGHAHGDFDDSTTTIMHKGIAMSHGIDLRSPAAYSMSRHRRQRRVVWAILGVIVACVMIGAIRWMVRG